MPYSRGMTTPPSSGNGSSGESSDESEAPFDPYRYGHPDVPPAPEYAPPGYQPPAPSAAQPAPPAPGAPYPPPQNWDQPPPDAQAPYGQPSYGQPPYGPPSYGQPPYGQPPYGPNQNPYGVPPQFAQKSGNGKATAGLVLGILAILMFWLTFFDAIFIITALIFAILGLNDSKVRGSGRGNAIAGIVCAVIGAVLAIVFTVFVVHLSNECGGTGNQNSSSYRQCIRDKL
jgi:hypothetical protein